MARPNFFDLWELDPDTATVDDIRAAIQRKRNEWSRIGDLQSQEYLSLIPEMEEMLEDPSSLKEEERAFRE